MINSSYLNLNLFFLPDLIQLIISWCIGCSLIVNVLSKIRKQATVNSFAAVWGFKNAIQLNVLLLTTINQWQFWRIAALIDFFPRPSFCQITQHLLGSLIRLSEMRLKALLQDHSERIKYYIDIAYKGPVLICTKYFSQQVNITQ